MKQDTFQVTIAALGTPGQTGMLVMDAIKSAKTLFLQTVQTPCAGVVLDLGKPCVSMDDLYETAEDFDELSVAVAKRLAEAGSCVYAVPGRGIGKAQMDAIKSAVQEKGGIVRVLPGIGYAQAAAAQAGFEAQDAMLTVAAGALPMQLDPELDLAVEEVDCQTRAGEVKLYLSEYWPDEWEILFCTMQPDGSYRVEKIPLYLLDQQKNYHAETVVLVPAAEMLQLTRHGYHQLEEVVAALRAPNGCPWDREQTHDSLKASLREECYEVLDAIDQQDDDALCEELGDVLLQCAMHACIAEEQARFTGRDIATGIVQKLIYRHPHVFGTEHMETSGAVLVRWEELKKKEKHFETQTDVLKAVPRSFPALLRSSKVQKKAAQVGFDWENAQEAFFKIAEETKELEEVMQAGGDPSEEMGDLLFAVVNVARLLKLDAEEVLAKAADKFIRRFEIMESLACAQGRKLEDMTLSEQDVLWNQAKTKEA